MKLTRLDGQAFHRSAPMSFHRSAPMSFHRSAPMSFHRSAPMSFRAKPRNLSPRLAVAARIPAERRGEITLPREVKSRPKLLDFPNAPAPIFEPGLTRIAGGFARNQ